MKIYSVLKYSFVGTILLMSFSINSFAQVSGSTNEKLIDLYVMGRYEDCYIKAAKMTESDKYKSESEPYLWVAMCLIELTKDPELEEFYPEEKTIKDALKYGAKFKKKDDKRKSKDLDYLFDDNEEFMYELIEYALIQGKSFLAMDNYSKGSYFYKLAAKLDPENQECQFMNGVVYLYNKNREGQVIVDNALDYYRAVAEAGGYEGNEKSHNAFVDSFIYYSRYLESKGKNGEAFDVIALAVKLEPKNQKFIQRYKKLSGE